MSLATKYRPTDFDNVIGQDTTVKILRQQILSNNVRNCYIFSGASGCGKTTVARIFASELNGSQNTAIEIDAASNNGVDNVRNIIGSANEHSINSKYKIFIMDEAHMLTTQAWNALLKTVEEPPRYTIFIFCTTNPEKIPDTIKNRCQRFQFTRISSTLIRESLEYICRQEGFLNFEETCDYISKNCNNQMRDAIAILEQVSDCDKTLDVLTAMAVIGSLRYDVMFDLINSMLDGDQKSVVSTLENLYTGGIECKTAVECLFRLLLDICKYILFGDINVTSIPSSYEKTVCALVNFANPQQIYNYYIRVLLELKSLQNYAKEDLIAYALRMARLE